MRHCLVPVTHSLALLSIVVLCAGWVGPASAAACDGLTVEHAWVPAAPPGVTVMAAYFHATNSSDATINLTGVSSPQFKHADMHKTVIDDAGSASMQAVGTVTLAPGESISFEPGGYHVMLFNPAKTLASGDAVTLELHCGDAQAVQTVTAEVHDRSSMAMDMSDHHGHMDHGSMGHGSTDHGNMDHGHMNMDHGSGHDMDHGEMHHDMDHGHSSHDG